MQRNLLIAAIGLLLLLPLAKQPPSNKTAIKSRSNKTNLSQIAEAKATLNGESQAPKKMVEAKPEPPAQPPKIYWAVASSPRINVTPEQINIALAHYQDLGLSKQGAAYLVGNFVGESSLVPCGVPGDGGLALGLGQWHPNRRFDMPCDYVAQLDWAFNVEMVRERPTLRQALVDPSTSAYTIMAEMYGWERWGQLGGRWIYAQNILSQI
jgi:hypothetical protein